LARIRTALFYDGAMPVGPTDSPSDQSGVASADSTPVWTEWKPVVKAVAGRPDLWVTALRQAVLLAPRGWWRQWPPVPMPAPGYLRFRMLTAYGDAEQPPMPGDVVTWLEWARSWASVTSSGHEPLAETPTPQIPSQADRSQV